MSLLTKGLVPYPPCELHGNDLNHQVHNDYQYCNGLIEYPCIESVKIVIVTKIFDVKIYADLTFVWMQLAVALVITLTYRLKS